MTFSDSFAIMHPTTNAAPASNNAITRYSRLLDADQPGATSRGDYDSSIPAISRTSSPITTSSENSGLHPGLHDINIMGSPVSSTSGEKGPTERPDEAPVSASKHTAGSMTKPLPHRRHWKTVSVLLGFILAGKFFQVVS
jgi:hypothetical protein